MVSSKVWLSWPDSSLFTLQMAADPYPRTSPAAGSSLSAPPVTIPQDIYAAVFDPRVPLTIAAVYAVTVIAVNRYNASRGNKPWAISKTAAFFWFVVAHNILLAVYSGWTFVGMFRALARTLPPLSSQNWLASVADSLCHMHGVPGLGNAITYNPVSQSWVSQSPDTLLLGPGGKPDPTDLGRLWNEGLAFYGWFFYLSKFYEVLDTFIILAKGKRSSTLQTYHHSGAMMCMWAGMRYMASPIWMFVFLNSGIHAMMYTYYTLTAFAVPIHNRIKRSLTTMQIMQFLFGASYAVMNSFVYYTAPIPFSAATAAAGYSTASPPASLPSAGAAPLLKKVLLRAAGTDGMGAGIAGEADTAQGMYPVGCVDTPGQMFAIWLNILYLAPLTALFVRFFIKSYYRRTGKAGAREKPQVAVEGAGADAWKGVERRMSKGLADGKSPVVNGKAGARRR